MWPAPHLTPYGTQQDEGEMGLYAELSDVKIIMRASSRERIRFSGDALRVIDIGQIQNTSIGDPYNQSKHPEPIYTLSILRNQVQIADTYSGRDLVTFIFTSATNYNVYFQDFKDNAYDKRDMLHGSGSISTTYVYNDISFPPAMWVGTPAAQSSVKIQFEADISNEAAEFFIEQAEIAIDNMLAAASVDYLKAGEQRLFLAPDIPPPVKMATQYLAAYYIYTNVFAEQSKDPNNSHFTDRWKRMCMDVLRDFAIWKNRLPPAVVSRINWSGNFADRVKCYLDTPIICPRRLSLDEDCTCGGC